MSGVVIRANGDRILLWCPGCESNHQINSRWTWNGNAEKPTISPSILVQGTQWEEASPFHDPRHRVAEGETKVCHSFVSEGRWEFLADSTHVLSGQTVDVVPIPGVAAEEADR